MGSPPDDEQMVLRAQCGDRDALERVLRGVQPSLHRFLRRLVGADDADDVLQDVLIAIARKLAWLSDPRLLRPWAFRIASRAAFRHIRRVRRRPFHDDAAVLDDVAAPAAPPSGELLRELLDGDAVSPASRAVLVLHFEEELPLAAVAAILEIPLGTAKSRLAYGLASLRRHLVTKRSP